MPSDPPRRSHSPTGRPTTRRATAKKPAPGRPGPSPRRLRIADVRRIRRQVLFSLYAVLGGELIAATFTTP
ncbi:MAG: hypothetical protein JWN14_3759, partial [Chthonomonadales bacterium]|nr:hypothetical protein [Chthonomonadales bacterium]